VTAAAMLAAAARGGIGARRDAVAMWKRWSIRVKITLAATLLAAVTTLLAAHLSHQVAVESHRSERCAQLRSTAALLAREIAPRDVLVPPPPRTKRQRFHRERALRERLQRVRATLIRFVEQNPEVQGAFVAIPQPGGSWSYLTRVGVRSHPDAPADGARCDDRDPVALQQAMAGPYALRNAEGEMLTGYAPIQNEGRSVAVVGVDSPRAHLQRVEATLFGRLLRSALLAALVPIALSFLVATRVSHGLRRVAEGLRGLYPQRRRTLNERRRPSDEMGELLDAFNQLVSALSASEERARRDPLTGVGNRTFLQESLDRELTAAALSRSTLCVLMVDVDHFKRINDEFGHQIGDRVLRHVARTIRRLLREGDLVARYGGEEFTVVLPRTSETMAWGIAERIREQIATTAYNDPELTDGALTGVTVSVGMACYPRHARDRDSLLMLADIALYHAKRMSRNRVCCYEPPMSEDLPAVTRAAAAREEEPHGARDLSAALEVLADVADERLGASSRSRWVAALAERMADRMDLPQSDREALVLAARIRDVGMIGVPDEILRKPSPLTDDERALLSQHVRIAESLLRRYPELRGALETILYHHEWYDGSGYPYGLREEQIPLLARALAICDAYVAMVSPRPYRPALPEAEARRELEDQAGRQFDPQLVRVFLEVLDSAPPPRGKWATHRDEVIVPEEEPLPAP